MGASQKPSLYKEPSRGCGELYCVLPKRMCYCWTVNCLFAPVIDWTKLYTCWSIAYLLPACEIQSTTLPSQSAPITEEKQLSPSSCGHKIIEILDSDSDWTPWEPAEPLTMHLTPFTYWFGRAPLLYPCWFVVWVGCVQQHTKLALKTLLEVDCPSSLTRTVVPGWLP